MHVEDTITMMADPDRVYRLGARVEDWPTLLPHYRYVRVGRKDAAGRLVRMGARRDWIPVSWSAVQQCFPNERRIAFRHVRGATTGMRVEWRIDPIPGGCTVTLTHDFRPDWPLISGWPTTLIVGRYFVQGIAHRTLGCIKAFAEAAPGPASRARAASGRAQ